MRRRSASPEAETMSHWPPPPSAMRVTISSDERASFSVILHPVCASNGAFQSGSTYPPQAIRFRAPSPGPIAVGGFMPAVGGCFVVDPEGVVEPHAVSAIAVAAATVASRNQTPDPACVVFIL